MGSRPIYTGKPWEQTVRHAPGNIASGSVVYTSGLTARDPDGKLVAPGEMRPQVEKVVANCKDVLAAAGADLSRILKLSIFVTSIPEFMANNGALQELMACSPSSTLVEVSALQEPGMVVELEAIAEISR
jgi:enamine deaminase RidA (YjgF/YER057c/UK114 family)